MLHLQGTIFYHDIDDAWELVVPWTNTGSQRLTGFEVEDRTVDFHGFRLTGNFTYVNSDIEETQETSLTDDETYTGNLILSYLNNDYCIRAELAGHYYWMSAQVRNEAPADGTFLWDLLLAKDFALPHISGEVYLRAHNLFNGSQYFNYEYHNPDRLVEVGLAFRY